MRNGEYQTLIRYLYEQEHGELPRTLVIRHECDNKLCINVKHVITGTIAQNIADRDRRGRTARGVTHGSRKLNEAQVRQILNSNAPYDELAETFNVNHGTIWLIKKRQTWRHVVADS